MLLSTRSSASSPADARLPRPRRARELPVRAARRGEARGAGARGRAHRLRQGDPREETEPFIREALADGVAPTMGYPLAAGLPELRAAIAAWVATRFGATLDPERRDRPDARLEGGDLPPRAGRRHDRRPRPRARDRARLSGAGARRALRRRPRRGAAAARGRRLPARPRRRPGGDLAARRARLDELPEQPDGRDGAARALRAARRARPRATTSSSPPTRPTASSTSGSRPSRRSSSPTGATSSR